MRWDNLLKERNGADEERAKLPTFREEVVLRRFKTKETETQMTLELDAPENRRVPSWVYKSS